MSPFLLMGILLAGYIGILALNFFRNLRRARQTGLHYFCMPIQQEGLIWHVTGRYHRSIISRLPGNVTQHDWFQLWYSNWRFHVKYDLHRKYGDVFLVVSPSSLTVEVADANVSSAVLDLDKPAWPYYLLDICGQNIVSARGENWKRHRKAVYPSFNNTTYEKAWYKSLHGASKLLSEWCGNEQCIKFHVPDMSTGIDTLVLRVILAVGYGVTETPAMKEIDDANPSEELKNEENYNGASKILQDLLQVVQNLKLLFMPSRLLEFGPKQWQHLGEAFKRTKDFLTRERVRRMDKDYNPLPLEEHGGNNILDGIVDLVKSSGDKNTFDSEKATSLIPNLTANDVQGNAFILIFAGVSTVANTLKYALVLLAMHPEIQEWLIDDLRRALADQPSNPDEWAFETIFPRLLAPLCVMSETLRHYPPNTSIIKWTGNETKPINLDGVSHVLPAQTTVQISLSALHCDPKHWGPNPRDYRPQNWHSRSDCRWATDSSSANDSAAQSTPDDTAWMRTPEKGSFLPFSDKARSCVGKRFAQVEFAAILAVIFRGYRVQLAVAEGQTWEETKAETQAILDQSLIAPTMRMMKPVPLQFFRQR